MNLALLVILGLIILVAVLGASALIALVLLRSRTNTQGSQPTQNTELNSTQVDEIVSTNNLLNH